MRVANLLIAIVLGVTITATAPAQLDLKGKTLKQTFDELLPKLDTQAAQQQWQNLCIALGAPGNEAQRA